MAQLYCEPDLAAATLRLGLCCICHGIERRSEVRVAPQVQLPGLVAAAFAIIVHVCVVLQQLVHPLVETRV
eukprot:61135-Prymnesium_polylepis.1